MDRMEDNELDRLNSVIQSRRREREPARLGDVLNRLIAQRGYLQTLNSEQLREVWTDVAGSQLAGETQPGNVRRGTLEVFASDSCVIQELTFRKTQLLAKLQQVAPELKIRDLKFRVGKIQ